MLGCQSLCMEPCTNQCFGNNNLTLSKLNFTNWIIYHMGGFILRIACCRNAPSAYRTQSFDVLSFLNPL